MQATGLKDGADTSLMGQCVAFNKACLASALESCPSAAAEHLSNASSQAGPDLRAWSNHVRACAGVSIVICNPSSLSRTGSCHWSVNFFSLIKSVRNNP